MKKLLIILLIIPVFMFSQTTEELDFVAPFNDNVAAVKKDNSWGFINDKGDVSIAFRDDLVLTKIEGQHYPIFKDNRCLISETKQGIIYFGYIDKTGKTVIEPKFLNALNFNNNQALVLELIKRTVGNNDILEKPVVYNKYFEVIIDAEGNIKKYLNPEGINIFLDKKFLDKPPKIISKIISNNLVSTMNKNEKWFIQSIK
ncbi:WG containing repeat-containing protein [Flaviramulus basaltis]|uniref:WG containing repeat-containing protein n=1 Tax=Flaviramulus basaltis TaxID=369401 RepID=A0A1K2IJ58_9FLAO|nr:WG repeat-containing protein [Flaviramulus basaltis]SFZ92298.1 WG containing repeat-containing protein [Flaviramulus basaltis]